MCGIIGVFSKQPVVKKIAEGLKRLEYRGYDSAGIAILDANGTLQVRRATGKIVQLQERLHADPMDGCIGIGHTRWATHGAPLEKNAHPLTNGRVCVVHNGIIENNTQLRQMLSDRGHIFTSDTATEVLVHLISDFLDQGRTPQEAFHQAINQLEGAFAVAILFAQEKMLMGARQGSPLVVGVNNGETFLGSDALGLAPFTNEIMYLEEGDRALITEKGVQLWDGQGSSVERSFIHVPAQGLAIAKDGFPHFMLKEIFEQPSVVGDTLASVLNTATRTPLFSREHFPLPHGSTGLYIVACGTSYYAALTAKYWIESWARIPVHVEMASEFRYRNPPLVPGGTALFVSQSGETADTLAALHHAKSQGQRCIALVNVATSSMARLADTVLLTDAGIEIGVAATKAFTCQLIVLCALGLFWGWQKDAPGGGQKNQGEHKTFQAIIESLIHLPTQMQDVLHNTSSTLQEIASLLLPATTILYLGRGVCFPLALEGALKMKEISYIHAEGFPAGEMKHGPIALIDTHTPVIVLAPSNDVWEKTMSNTQEVLARGATVIFITDAAGVHKLPPKLSHLHPIIMPTLHPMVAPILYALPLQLLAYHTAVLKGTDVDQPRNLAKSVTVE